ncbi:hypothetical protein Tco_1555192 [Tanacetum coccineum]
MANIWIAYFTKRDEVRNAVWGCGENKSPGPDGFSFEFFRKFWDTKMCLLLWFLVLNGARDSWYSFIPGMASDSAPMRAGLSINLKRVIYLEYGVRSEAQSFTTVVSYGILSMHGSKVILSSPFQVFLPRIFALETNKDSVGHGCETSSVTSSLRPSQLDVD